MTNTEFVLRTLFNMCLPIIKGTAVFQSFRGQYSDNPKYISEELHKRHPEIKIFWIIGEGEEKDFPDYVETVREGSAEHSKYIARAELSVDNYCGPRTNFLKENNLIKRLCFWLLSRSRRGQLCLSTWHGTPLKHIALDEPKYQRSKFKRAYVSADVLIAGCQLTADAFKTAFDWKGPIEMCGTPRNDLLFAPNDTRLKEKLGIDENKRLLLFAPTYRNSIEMSGICQLNCLNIEAILERLSSRLGGEWCFVFRGHNLVASSIPKDKKNVIDGNACPDMAEYLAAADLLLTDYSSSMFDFMLTRRPVLLYTPDLDEYKNSERGFYFDIEDTPFPISLTADGILEKIDSLDVHEYQKKVDAFLEKIGNIERGNAAKRAVDLIERRLFYKPLQE